MKRGHQFRCPERHRPKVCRERLAVEEDSPMAITGLDASSVTSARDCSATRVSPPGVGDLVSRKRVLLVSHHFLIRDGLKKIIESLDTKYEVVEVKSLRDIDHEIGDAGDIALVILDLAVPRLGEPTILRAICARCPGIPVVAVGDSTARGDVIAVLDCGVASYVPKSLDRERTQSAFRLITSGEEYVPLSFLVSTPDAGDFGGDRIPAPSPDQGKVATLTPRESGVLKLVARGYTNDQIANELGVRSSTVKVHVKNLRQKLGAANRTQAVVIAQRLNLIGHPATVGDAFGMGTR